MKRYVIVGNESQIIREVSTHKPLISSSPWSASAGWEAKVSPVGDSGRAAPASNGVQAPHGTLSLLEIGKRAAMEAERGAIERALNETRWNRRQAAKLLKVSYKALLNKMKRMEDEDLAKKKSILAG